MLSLTPSESLASIEVAADTISRDRQTFTLQPFAGRSETIEPEYSELGPFEKELGGVTARLSYRNAPDEDVDPMWVPTLEILVEGERLLTIEGESSGWDWTPALVQIAELDPRNRFPEVIFSTYTGGAHCCNDVRIATSTADAENWAVISVGTFDGEPTETRDLDGDGIYEWVSYDTSFLYAFTSYAQSFAPTTIHHLADRELIENTTSPDYHFVHAEWLKEQGESLSGFMKDTEYGNGFFAAYVAVKAVLGEFDEAWDIMLKHYDRNSDWELAFCEGGYDDAGECQNEKRYSDFPEALRALLIRRGYIRPE